MKTTLALQSFQRLLGASVVFAVALLFAATASADWWTSSAVEETRKPAPGLAYQRVLYTTINEQPIRAHILSVTGVDRDYIFGVHGSYGALVQPSVFSRNSQAVAVVNGGFFSVNPTRAAGLVVAHGKVLYPPPSSGKYQGSVGFTPDRVLIGFITPNDIIDDQIKTKKPGWNDCHAVIGAGPILVNNAASQTKQFALNFNIEQRAPRTAIGLSENGDVLLVVIDGRQPEWSAGVTLPELADLFTAQGAVCALNLDGGGSSTMIIQNEIVNRPSDYAVPGQPGRERPVANVVALLKKTP